MARPRTELTDEQIKELETLAAVLNQKQIADYFGVPHRTFQAILERDDEVSASYKKGKSKAIASIAGGLLKQAREGNTSAAIFYLKTQAKWSEKTEIDISGDAFPTQIIIKGVPASVDESD